MQGPLQELQPLLLSVLPAARFRKAFLPQLLTVSAHAVPLITSTPTLCCHGYLCVLSPNNACNVIVLKRKQSLIHFKLKQRPSVLQRMQTQPGRWLLRATRGLTPEGPPLLPADSRHSLQTTGGWLVQDPLLHSLWALRKSCTAWGEGRSIAMCQKLATDRKQRG